MNAGSRATKVLPHLAQPPAGGRCARARQSGTTLAVGTTGLFIRTFILHIWSRESTPLRWRPTRCISLAVQPHPKGASDDPPTASVRPVRCRSRLRPRARDRGAIVGRPASGDARGPAGHAATGNRAGARGRGAAVVDGQGVPGGRGGGVAPARGRGGSEDTRKRWQRDRRRGRRPVRAERRRAAVLLHRRRRAYCDSSLEDQRDDRRGFAGKSARSGRPPLYLTPLGTTSPESPWTG